MDIFRNRSFANHFAIRPAFVGLAALGLAGCSTLGAPYGYSGVSVGVGYNSGGYYDPYYGWYDDFYYPGVGRYVYDRRGYRHRWNNRHQRYWQSRRARHRDVRAHWDGYSRGRDGYYHDPRSARRADRREYRRADRREDRREARRDQRRDQREARRDRRAERAGDERRREVRRERTERAREQRRRERAERPQRRNLRQRGERRRDVRDD